MGRRRYHFSILTLGCAKNEVDSARMKQLLCAAGYRYVKDAFRAEVILVNTCAFLQSATEESLDMIFEACGLLGKTEGADELVGRQM